MKKEHAECILELYGNPRIRIGNNNLVFARQTNEDIKLIESLSDNELISEWKSLVWLNCIYGQVSLNGLQRIDLIELEMASRNRQHKFRKLREWFRKAKEKYDDNNDNI